MIDPEVRDRLIPAVLGALATIVGLVELGTDRGPLDVRVTVMAVAAGLLCFAGHALRAYEFTKAVVASQLVLGLLATIQVAVVGADKFGGGFGSVPVLWMVLATPALHVGILAKQAGVLTDHLYLEIIMVFGALAPSGLLWFDGADLGRIQFAVALGLVAVIAALIVARSEEQARVDEFVA